jgi:hypothetical protein
MSFFGNSSSVSDFGNDLPAANSGQSLRLVNNPFAISREPVSNDCGAKQATCGRNRENLCASRRPCMMSGLKKSEQEALASFPENDASFGAPYFDLGIRNAGKKREFFSNSQENPYSLSRDASSSDFLNQNISRLNLGDDACATAGPACFFSRPACNNFGTNFPLQKWESKPATFGTASNQSEQKALASFPQSNMGFGRPYVGGLLRNYGKKRDFTSKRRDEPGYINSYLYGVGR